jgi:hypothetical protein
MKFRKLACLLLVAAAAAVDYDCDVGCSMDTNVAGPKVCGVDGLTYGNECLAYCQVGLFVFASSSGILLNAS